MKLHKSYFSPIDFGRYFPQLIPTLVWHICLHASFHIGAVKLACWVLLGSLSSLFCSHRFFSIQLFRSSPSLNANNAFWTWLPWPLTSWRWGSKNFLEFLLGYVEKDHSDLMSLWFGQSQGWKARLPSCWQLAGLAACRKVSLPINSIQIAAAEAFVEEFPGLQHWWVLAESFRLAADALAPLWWPKDTAKQTLAPQLPRGPALRVIC